MQRKTFVFINIFALFCISLLLAATGEAVSAGALSYFPIILGMLAASLIIFTAVIFSVTDL